MKTLYMTDEDGEEISFELPTKFAICDECEGKGKHSHAIDGNGITASEWEEWDSDEKEFYLHGDYDRPCSPCKGSGKVKVVDEDSLSEKELKAWRDQCEDEYFHDLAIAAERRSGC